MTALMLPAWVFSVLVWGALVMTGVGGAALLVLLVQDLRGGRIW